MNATVYNYIKKVVPEENVLLEEPLSKHTTFRVGGNATCLIRIQEPSQLSKLIPYLTEVEQPFFIMGNGSNLLVGDKGYRGIVFEIADAMNQITVEGTRITVQAGALMSQIARQAYEHELTGLEFASGIPGTIGGGVVMNAGAYDGELKQVVEAVTVLNENGELMELDNETMEFGYRTSIIKNRKFIVLSVTLNLQKGEKAAIKQKMEEFAQKRREKQPLEFASAGSTFKRPEGNFAGKLIMEAGMRGFMIGGARVSEKHCGFVINTGNATAEDIREVIRSVQEKVKERFNVDLETEVIFLGDF